MDGQAEGEGAGKEGLVMEDVHKTTPAVPVATLVDGCVVHGDKPLTGASLGAMREVIAATRKHLLQVHRCYECERPEGEFAACKVCNPDLRD